MDPNVWSKRHLGGWAEEVTGGHHCCVLFPLPLCRPQEPQGTETTSHQNWENPGAGSDPGLENR